jgi:hypothetical protein
MGMNQEYKKQQRLALAKRAAEKILIDIRGRSGMDYDIDHETIEQMKAAWAET